ncbi:zinc-ribbon domain-containing protein [Bifidobacterium callitrichos]|uniref:Zinc-ribbon domain-containing protein n=2 Tax=Bifidobacterium callitrichos TaxID=762209 RepID=A0A5M9ZAK6_9BIFI|nr:zinc-ribbon domain-containing protein [Bifidobacterium callitrichos]
MKYCSQCGAQNPQTARFCRQCGHQFSMQPAAPVPPPASPAEKTTVLPHMPETGIGTMATQPIARPNDLFEQPSSDLSELAALVNHSMDAEPPATPAGPANDSGSVKDDATSAVEDAAGTDAVESKTKASTESEMEAVTSEPVEPVVSVEPVASEETRTFDESAASDASKSHDEPVPDAEANPPMQETQAAPVQPMTEQPYQQQPYGQPAHPQQPGFQQPTYQQPAGQQYEPQYGSQPGPQPFVQPNAQPQPGPQYASQYGPQSGPQYGSDQRNPYGQPGYQPQPGFTQPQPGYQQPNYQQQPGQGPAAQPSRFEAEARTFGTWLKTFFSKPTDVGKGQPWYAIVVILAVALISAWSCLLVISHGGSSILNAIPVSSISSSIGNEAQSAALPVFMLLWITFALYDYGSLAVAWLMLRIEGDPTTFGSFHDRVAHALGPWAVLNIVAFLLALVQLDPLAMLIWMLATSTRITWMTSLVWNGEVHRGLDPHWVRFLCVLLQGVLIGILLFILMTITGAVLGSIVASHASNYLQQFTGGY